jgi:hypothetical protein
MGGRVVRNVTYMTLHVHLCEKHNELHFSTISVTSYASIAYLSEHTAEQKSLELSVKMSAQNLCKMQRNILKFIWNEVKWRFFRFFNSAVGRRGESEILYKYVYMPLTPVTVAEWSNVCTIFARSEAGIVG